MKLTEEQQEIIDSIMQEFVILEDKIIHLKYTLIESDHKKFEFFLLELDRAKTFLYLSKSYVLQVELNYEAI